MKLTTSIKEEEGCFTTVKSVLRMTASVTEWKKSIKIKARKEFNNLIRVKDWLI